MELIESILEFARDNFGTFIDSVWVNLLLLSGLGVAIWWLVQVHLRNRYQGQIDSLSSRLEGCGEETIRLRQRLTEAEPTTILQGHRAVRELVEEELRLAYANTQKVNEQEIKRLRQENAKAQDQQHAVEREKAVIGKQLESLHRTYLEGVARRDSVIEELQRDNRQLERLKSDAPELGSAIARGALRRAEKERQDYERRKDTTLHIFLKNGGDYREEFAGFEQEMMRQVGAETCGSVESVEIHDAAGQTLTLVRVVGHDWFTLMKSKKTEGWTELVRGRNDTVGVALSNWGDKLARTKATTRAKTAFTLGSRIGSDFVTFYFDDEHGKEHCLAILATLENGCPVPMGEYFEGTDDEIHRQVSAWLDEHRTHL